MNLSEKPKLLEIFKGNEKLLEANEVKELINYFELTYSKLVKQYEMLQEQEFDILHELMHSEVVVKNGTKAKDVVKKCLEIHENNF